jgi:ribose 5-phosphate isomerase A
MSFPSGPLEALIAEEAQALDADAQAEAKKAAALAAVALVEDGMTVGLGTGSTVAYFLEKLAQRVAQEGLRVRGVPTSLGTQAVAEKVGIPLVSGGAFPDLANDLCVDGADRVDAFGQLIKGGGGALLREKMVAAASRRLCIMVDASKLEPVLSDSFALPVECLAFGIESTLRHLGSRGCQVRLRQRGGEPWLTDNGNYVADCAFPRIDDPAATQATLLAIPGVVEVGLFVDMMSTLILGRPDGSCRLWNR